MKKIFLLSLLLILSASFILAETKVVEKLDVGSNTTVNGKTLTILATTEGGSVKLQVDGKKDIIKSGDPTREVNGMKLKITNYTYVEENFVQITMEITVDAECGDGACDKNMSESQETCCTDCGCTTGVCISNICTTQEQATECSEDSECNDDNTCTTDKCESGKCVNEDIKECKAEDGCCPEGCKYDNDTDCEFLGTCENDIQCDDNNSCTTDKCEGKPSGCTHQTMTGCDSKGACYNITERIEGKYCTEEGMKPQKGKGESCNTNYECLENQCTKNICGKESKKGLYIGVTVAILTLLALIFAGYSIFRKKE